MSDRSWGSALVEAAIASQSSAAMASGLEKLRAAGGTGPAFVAFGERAVVHATCRSSSWSALLLG